LGNLATPKSVQKLQTALQAKAKAEAGYRFYALYDKISRDDILAHAYAQCRSNKGRAGYRRPGFCGHRGIRGRPLAPGRHPKPFPIPAVRNKLEICRVRTLKLSFKFSSARAHGDP